jgi:hypothetical protein
MVNLQKKRAYRPEFINSMFGKKMLWHSSIVKNVLIWDSLFH